MHELGVTQNILQIALEHAQKAGAKKIHRIHLVIGGLSGVIDESVQFYFDFVSQGNHGGRSPVGLQKGAGPISLQELREGVCL